VLTKARISEKTRNFIFQHVDSVELVEILLLFHGAPQEAWTAEQIAKELRSSANSIEKRLTVLRNLGLITETAEPNQFCYQTKDEGQAKIVDELSLAYRVHRHRILEIIFSPSKKARDFADAFVVTGHKKDDGDGHG